MSSLEGNKIFAAVLVGGMITLGVGIATDFLYRPHRAAEAAHEGGAEPAGKKGPAPVEPVLGLIANADVAKGETIAKKCLTCHSFDAAGANKVGPGLYGVIGRPAGTHEGFAYSEPMKALGKAWTYADISRLITRPKDFLPGTKMTFPGLPNAQDRADLLAWLRNQAPSPAPLPTADEIAAEEAAFKSEQEAAPAEAEASAAAPAAEGVASADAGSDAAAPASEGEQTAAAAPAGDANAVAMIASADPAQGQKIAAKCKACHDLAQGGKNKIGPHLWGIVATPAAQVAGFAYSDALKKLAGKPWTFEELDKYLTNPKEYAPGTKMSFPGLKKPEERAALLRWLRDQSDSPAPLPQ